MLGIRSRGRSCISHREVLFLFLVALAVYLPGIDWGLPYASGPDRVNTWSYDDIAPLAALTEVYHTFVQDAPPCGRGHSLWIPRPLAWRSAPLFGWNVAFDKKALALLRADP